MTVFSDQQAKFTGAVGLPHLKPPVRLATAGALAAYTRSVNTITADGDGAMADVDGVAVAVGDRILLKNGAAAADNGIWVITDVGGVSDPFVLTRAFDMNESAMCKAGASVHVSEGDTLANTHWFISTNDPITLNTTGITWTTYPDDNALTALLASTANGEGASLVAIEDAGTHFTATDVEGALAEIVEDLAATTNGLGASLVGIEDVATNFTATTVEGALAEIVADLAATTATNGASRIGVQDAGTLLTATTVEAALAEIRAPAPRVVTAGDNVTLGVADNRRAVHFSSDGGGAATIAAGTLPAGGWTILVMTTFDTDAYTIAVTGGTLTFNATGEAAILYNTGAALVAFLAGATIV